MQFASWGQRVSKAPLRLLNQQHSLPIAIDFGAAALKILQVTGGDSASLVAAACLDTPDELISDHAQRLAFQVEALPRLIRGSGFTSKRAVCAIPAGQTFCTHLQLTPGDNGAIREQIAATVPAQLGCEPESLVFRHLSVGQVGRTGKAGKIEVVCMAVARDLVERLMGALAASRLEPVGMHNEFTATLRAFDAITQRRDDHQISSMYLDLGARSTKVLIAHGRELVFARTIDIGGHALDECVAGTIKRALPEARRRRLALESLTGSRAVAEAGDGDVATRLAAPPLDCSAPLEILTDEVAMCLRYYQALFPEQRVNRVIFVGGEARHTALCRHVARSIGVHAQVGDPLARVARTGKEPTTGVDLRAPQPGWAMALGLCLCPTDL